MTTNAGENMDTGSHQFIRTDRKRVREFLKECDELGKQKIDIEMLVTRKRAELYRTKEQISTLKRKIRREMQKLSVKEAVFESVGRELRTLEDELLLSA